MLEKSSMEYDTPFSSSISSVFYEGAKHSLYIIPLDSSNRRIVKRLYQHRNFYPHQAFQRRALPLGQSINALIEMIAARDESDDFYFSVHLSMHSDILSFEPSADIFCGTIQAIWIDRVSRVVEIGLDLLPQFIGFGFGPYILDLFINRLGSYCNVYKFLSHSLSVNTSSFDLFTSRGFLHIGTYREHFMMGNERFDVDLLELLFPNYIPLLLK